MFEKIEYSSLNHRQKENYNFHKIAARLADFGYTSIRLSDDFEGADFIALHADGATILKIQLKGRLNFEAKYYGKGLHIAFREGEDCYVYPHDELRERMVSLGMVENSSSVNWVEHGSRSWPRIPKKMKKLLGEYKL